MEIDLDDEFTDAFAEIITEAVKSILDTDPDMGIKRIVKEVRDKLPELSDKIGAKEVKTAMAALRVNVTPMETEIAATG